MKLNTERQRQMKEFEEFEVIVKRTVTHVKTLKVIALDNEQAEEMTRAMMQDNNEFMECGCSVDTETKVTAFAR